MPEGFETHSGIVTRTQPMQVDVRMKCISQCFYLPVLVLQEQVSQRNVGYSPIGLPILVI